MGIEKIDKNERNLISKSKCLSYLNKRFIDEDGKPFEGVHKVFEDFKALFVDGYIDGNVYDKNGIIVARRPAIKYEDDGMEFWFKGTPSGSPAVIQDGGKYEESWQGGVIRNVLQSD